MDGPVILVLILIFFVFCGWLGVRWGKRIGARRRANEATAKKELDDFMS